MARKFGFKPSLAVQQRQNRAAMLAAISDPAQRERFLRDFPEGNMRPLPKPRAAHGADGRSLEADVKNSVASLLARHPKVSYALRINSGMAYNAAGAPVRFHQWVRSPERCSMPDFFGALVTGRTIALECKRPGWSKPTDDREREQAAFLALIRKIGGIGEFITDAAQVDALLA